MATYALFATETSSQRSASVMALTHISLPAPYFSNSRSELMRNGVSLTAEMK